MTTPYSEQVEKVFEDTSPDQFGDAHATRAELGALRALHSELGRDRAATLEAIKRDGYPLPEGIAPEMIALTGAAHACGVTVDLAENRGVEGKDSTYESYTIKNRFDRFVRKHLPEHLREEWDAPIDREEGFANTAVSYPKGVDETKIHGGALPHRFLPAQTMRYLEFARLGKLDDETKEDWDITQDTDLAQFSVDWDTLVPAIESATSLLGLTSNIADELANQLQANGLSQDQIVSIISKGFGVNGIIKEHGNIDQISNYADISSKEAVNLD